MRTHAEIMAAATLIDRKEDGDIDYGTFFGLTLVERQTLADGWEWRCIGVNIGSAEWHSRICKQIADILNARENFNVDSR